MAAPYRTEPLSADEEAKIEEVVFGSDWFLNLPEAVQSAYRRFPPWHFYEKENGTPVRVVGINEAADGSTSLDTCVALLMMTNRTIGGCPESQVRRVQRWSPDQLLQISMRNQAASAAFADPMGFGLLARG